MSPSAFLPGWYPLMRARDLGMHPTVRTLAGTSLVLWRSRNAHWQAREEMSGAQRDVVEQEDWIFVSLGDPPTDLPETGKLLPSRHRTLQLEGIVRAPISDVGENILDTTHTSVVHEDYLRTPGAARPVEAVLSSGEGWISASYPPGAAPAGWGARLLGAHRYTITDTFRAPAIAEVSYTRRGGAAFSARFHLTPVSAIETYVAATLAVPGGGAFAALKLAALRAFFLRIFAEDRSILELIGTNRSAHGSAPLVFTPQDLLRPGIDAILSGRRPLVTAPRVTLKV